MDPSNAQRLWTGGFFMWRTTNGAGSWTKASSQLCGTGSVSAIAVAPTNPNRVLSGNSRGCINRTTTALTSTSATPWGSSQPPGTNGAYVSWLAFDPGNDNVAYATYSTFGVPHVWKSTDGGATWMPIDGSGSTGVPDIPVHSIVVDPTNTARLYIGTDLGVLMSRDGGATWQVEVTGFANVITEALALGKVGTTSHLFAFTHGRGAWRVASADTATPAPTVTTNPATDVSPTGATLNGTVNPNGSATTAFFQYGPTTSYSSRTAIQSLGAGATAQPVSAAVTALPCATLYHFRAVANNAGGTTSGSDQIFTTAACTGTPPTVTTNPATDVGPSGATLNGTVNPNGSATTAFFQYGPTTSYGSQTATQSFGAGTTAQPMSAAITGLACATLYHFRAVANNAGGMRSGSDQTFTTAACTGTAPTVTTNPATDMGSTGATLKGTVNPNGSATTAFFQYGPTTSYGSQTAIQSLGAGTTAQPVSAAITGLACATLYHFRAVANNAGGTRNGATRPSPRRPAPRAA